MGFISFNLQFISEQKCVGSSHGVICVVYGVIVLLLYVQDFV